MKNSLKALYEQGVGILNRSSVDDAGYNAACMLEQLFGYSKVDILLMPDKELPYSVCNGFISACKRRADGEPLQYILGKWEFMGIEFSVNPSVLIPRADTETVVEYIIDNCKNNGRVLDMCCGSGCIGLAIKHFFPDADVTLSDVSEKALQVAQLNAKTLGINVNTEIADLLCGSSAYFADDSFDVIVSNPPYIRTADMDMLSREVRHEPKLALDGGKDGTDFYRALILNWKSALKPGGEMVLETGYDTAQAVWDLFVECEYCDIRTRRDYNGIVRCISAKRSIDYEDV